MNSTSKNLPLDLGLIAHSKIEYRLLLLRKVVHRTMRRSSGAHSLPENSGGEVCLQDVYRPHLGDAMDLFNYCWSETKARTIIKYWMKSDCISNLQIQQCEQIFHDYRNKNVENFPNAPIEQN